DFAELFDEIEELRECIIFDEAVRTVYSLTRLNQSDPRNLFCDFLPFKMAAAGFCTLSQFDFKSLHLIYRRFFLESLPGKLTRRRTYTEQSGADLHHQIGIAGQMMVGYAAFTGVHPGAAGNRETTRQCRDCPVSKCTVTHAGHADLPFEAERFPACVFTEDTRIFIQH